MTAPVLIYVTDRWGCKVRINKNDLDDPRRRMLPIYNSRGVKITDMRTYDHRKHSGMTHIIRENILGTPENAESEAACAELIKKWESE